MIGTKEPLGNPAVAGATVRLALRQQNLGVLLPVLLHDVNGALNGVTLSTELLARLPTPGSGPGEGGASAATLLQRTRSELVRLKQALKLIEQRLMPAGGGPAAMRAAPLGATVRDVQAVLMPAVRRSQHELRLALPEATEPEGGDPQVALRPDELFDLVAGLLIVAIEGAAPQGLLEVSVEGQGPQAQVSVVHGAAAHAGMGLEVHRELLRQAAAHAGGSVEWHQSASGVRARMRLPRRSPA